MDDIILKNLLIQGNWHLTHRVISEENIHNHELETEANVKDHATDVNLQYVDWRVKHVDGCPACENIKKGKDPSIDFYSATDLQRKEDMDADMFSAVHPKFQPIPWNAPPYIPYDPIMKNQLPRFKDHQDNDVFELEDFERPGKDTIFHYPRRAGRSSFDLWTERWPIPVIPLKPEFVDVMRTVRISSVDLLSNVPYPYLQSEDFPTNIETREVLYGLNDLFASEFPSRMESPKIEIYYLEGRPKVRRIP